MLVEKKWKMLLHKTDNKIKLIDLTLPFFMTDT